MAIIGIGKARWLWCAALLMAGCCPSWSPDSSQVIFPYIYHTKEASGVALYDRPTGKAVEILPAVAERTVQAVLFSENGRDAIVVCAAEGEEDAGAILVLALPSGKIIRKFPIASRLDAPYSGFVVADGNLLYSPMAIGDEAAKEGDAAAPQQLPVGLRLLNLQDGGIERLFTDRLLTVARAGKSLAYVETVRDPQARDIAIRCGWLDLDKRILTPIAGLMPQDLGWQTAMASPIAFAAAAAEPPRFALIAVPGAAEITGTATKTTANEYALVVMEGKDILLKKMERSSYWLRFISLSADGKRLFTPEIRDDICGVRDIAVASGDETFVALVKRVSLPPRQSARTPAVLTTVGLALSPDQRHLAVNPQFRFSDPPPAALYLIELAERGSRDIKPIRLPEPIEAK